MHAGRRLRRYAWQGCAMSCRAVASWRVVLRDTIAGEEITDGHRHLINWVEWWGKMVVFVTCRAVRNRHGGGRWRIEGGLDGDSSN